MTKQTTAWKYGSNKDTNAGRNGNQGKNRTGNNNKEKDMKFATQEQMSNGCLLYTSPSPRDKRQSRMPSSA